METPLLVSQSCILMESRSDSRADSLLSGNPCPLSRMPLAVLFPSCAFPLAFVPHIPVIVFFPAVVITSLRFLLGLRTTVSFFPLFPPHLEP